MYVRTYLPTFVSNLSAFLVAILNDARQKIMEKKSPVKKRVRNESVKGTTRKDCWMFMEIKNYNFFKRPPSLSLPNKRREKKYIKGPPQRHELNIPSKSVPLLKCSLLSNSTVIQTFARSTEARPCACRHYWVWPAWKTIG